MDTKLVLSLLLAALAVLLELLERFGSAASIKEWPPHPMFGRLSGPLWSRLTYRHFDHHLKQFGV